MYSFKQKWFNRKVRNSSVAAAVAALCGAGVAYGMDQPGAGQGPEAAGWHRCGGHEQHGRFGRHGFGAGQHTEGKLAFLKTELKITPQQEPAWEAFSQAMRDVDTQRGKMHETMRAMHDDGDKGSLVDRLDRRVTMMDTGLAQIKSLSTAVKKLYKELSPEQQKVADNLFPFAGRGRHHRG